MDEEAAALVFQFWMEVPSDPDEITSEQCAMGDTRRLFEHLHAHGYDIVRVR